MGQCVTCMIGLPKFESQNWLAVQKPPKNPEDGNFTANLHTCYSSCGVSFLFAQGPPAGNVLNRAIRQLRASAAAVYLAATPDSIHPLTNSANAHCPGLPSHYITASLSVGGSTCYSWLSTVVKMPSNRNLVVNLWCKDAPAQHGGCLRPQPFQ